MNRTESEEPMDERDEMDDKPPTLLGEEPPERQASEPSTRPALTITIQSWSTPVVGLAILAIGILTGYYGRPLINPGVTPAPPSAVSPPPTVDPAQSSSTDQENRQQALMEALIAQTVHFKGNPAAPVTLIEFSDFQ